ncbi:MAG: threonine synthase [Chloroflexota bacterium]|nr:threonine synthase [Chloroflexota bacterium]MDE2968994.1 threonine synthase [Chloroflexota bacterium]
MAFASALKCRECGREYPTDPLNVCEFCFGPLEVVYDYEAISRVVSRERILNGPLTMWRYQDLLPVDGDNAVDLQTGFTPLMKAPNLGRMLGLDHLYIKNDAVNPTNSFKDRVVSVASTKALEYEFKTLACASTGNLAGSVAAHAARAGMTAYIFIPADLEKGKVIGAAIYGPTVVAINGSYDDVNRLCSELADTYPWAFVNINMRPYYAEGSKTLGYEVAEQLGWQAPAHCIVPSASGSMFTKIWKGFKEFEDLELIPKVHTHMHMTQAAGCAPIAEAYEAGVTRVRPVKPDTVAKSLAIGNPADGYYSLKTIQESDGDATIVPEEEVVTGIQMLAETEGIFTETAGGVVISGLKRLVERGAIKRDEVTVAYITGNGLKTLEAVEHTVKPVTIDPTTASFEAEVLSA